jgi:predicted NUDIX family NTP pyrophosphohydrolase
MPILTAGVLLYRTCSPLVEVLLVHPGGPYWAGKDIGAWSVPKGHVEPGEDEYQCALRELREETGFETHPVEEPRDLGVVRQSSSKMLRVWAIEEDWNPANLISNTFDMEWPPRSGRIRRFPEVDRAEWLDQAAATTRIVKGQRQVIEAFYISVGIGP